MESGYFSPCEFEEELRNEICDKIEMYKARYSETEIYVDRQSNFHFARKDYSGSSIERIDWLCENLRKFQRKILILNELGSGVLSLAAFYNEMFGVNEFTNEVKSVLEEISRFREYSRESILGMSLNNNTSLLMLENYLKPNPLSGEGESHKLSEDSRVS